MIPLGHYLIVSGLLFAIGTAIGLNLGWAQIGLSRDDQPASAAGAPK